MMLKPREAWQEGTNISTAIKYNPELIRGWIMSEVGRLIKDLDANKTISSDDEIQFCCRSIIEEHPTLKLEELRACFNMVRQGKFGKLFERLKTGEILDFLRRYEGEVRTEVMAKLREEYRNTTFDYESNPDAKNLTKYLADVLDSEEKQREFDRAGTRLRKKLYDE